MIREAVVDAYVSFFQAKKKLYEATKPNFVLTDETIIQMVDETQQQFGEGYRLNDEEIELVIRRIKSLNTIFQEEGSALLGDYEHDYEWYNKLLNTEGFDEYYWNRYKNYLLNVKHFSPTIVDVLENKTLRSIMSYLGNPLEEDTTFSIRGLVVGDVQSGKTSNYLGLLSKAADAGYKVIFIFWNVLSYS